MTRRYVRGRRGRRGYAKANSRWRTTTFIAGLQHDGTISPFVIDGPINGAGFLGYVAQVLVPEHRPRDIVVRLRD